MLRVLGSHRMYQSAVVPIRRPWPDAGRQASGPPGRARAGARRRQGRACALTQASSSAPPPRASSLNRSPPRQYSMTRQMCSASLMTAYSSTCRRGPPAASARQRYPCTAGLRGCPSASLFCVAHAGVAGPGAGLVGSSVGRRTAPACRVGWTACARAAAARARLAAPLALVGRSGARAGARHALVAAELEHYVHLAPQARVVLGLHARALVRLDDDRLARGLAGRARHDRHAAPAPPAIGPCASAASARRVAATLQALLSASLRCAACWRRTLRAWASQELPCKETTSRYCTCPCTAPRGCQTGSYWCTPRPCCPAQSAAAARCAQGRRASRQQRTPPLPQRPANPGSCQPGGGQGAPQHPAGPALEQCGPASRQSQGPLLTAPPSLNGLLTASAEIAMQTGTAATLVC